MTELLDQLALIDRIVAALGRTDPRPPYSAFSPEPRRVEPPAFAMVVGAGFSVPVVPMVRTLMHESIGSYDQGANQDMEGATRLGGPARRDSRRFWKAFNEAAVGAGHAPVALDKDGLPSDPAAAYNRLFEYRVANALFMPATNAGHHGHTRHAKLMRGLAAIAPPPAPAPDALTLGTRYVDGFLRYVLAAGSEFGHGLTGMSRDDDGASMNAAHAELATILAAQQTGRLSGLLPFCRTVLTTNFDSLLQAALAAKNVLPVISDRPERGFDAAMFEAPVGSIHIVHLHGSVLRGNPASSTAELAGITQANAAVLADYLATRDVLVIGHSGWNDAVVAALGLRETARTLYWCDVREAPSERIAGVLSRRRGPSAYVRLPADGGAGGLMQALNVALHDAHRTASAQP